MQYREELSFLGWKASLCSLPTTNCDLFTSSIKPSDIFHVPIQFHAGVQIQFYAEVQIQFYAEVQFEIHGAPQLAAVSLNLDKHCKIVWRECCAFSKTFKNIVNPFDVWIAVTFLEKKYELVVEQQHWIAESHNSALLFSMLFNDVQLMFSFGHDDDTTFGFQLSFRCLIWCFNSITKFQCCWWVKGQFWCSKLYDVLNVSFRWIASIHLGTPFFNFSLWRLVFFKSFKLSTLSSRFPFRQVSEFSFHFHKNRVGTNSEFLR